MVNWRKVAIGVAAATIGAATFGAVHFMFLAPQFGVGDFMGLPLSVLLPFLLGTLGFVATYGIGQRWGTTVQNILLFGSSAAIGFGVAQYAGWVTPQAQALRARVSNVRPMPMPMQTVAPRPAVSRAGAGTKII